MDLIELKCARCGGAFEIYSTRGVTDQTIEPATPVPSAALARALKLNAHYADLLNMYDGGNRRTFTVEEWLRRIDHG